MLEASKLVFQARLDLCDNKTERIKAIEQTIKEFEPVLAQFERHYKAASWTPCRPSAWPRFTCSTCKSPWKKPDRNMTVLPPFASLPALHINSDWCKDR